MPGRPKRMAEEDFGPFFAEFYDAVVEGNRDYPREYARQASIHRRNTRRDLIRDHIANRLRALLDGRRGVNIRERHGTSYFHFFGRWVLKVHKLNDERHIVPNRTQLSLSLRENDPPRRLFEGATTVYLGYLEREDDVDVLLVCPDGYRRPWWEMLIEPPARGAVLPLPPRGPTPEDEDETLVVIPDEDADREADE